MGSHVVRSYNTITEQTTQELQEYSNRVIAQNRADYLDRMYGSIPGDGYYVVDIDADGNDIPPPPNLSTGDPNLDALIAGNRDEPH